MWTKRDKIYLIKKHPMGKNYLAICLFGLIFSVRPLTPAELNHEKIHAAQQKELLYLPFFLWYGKTEEGRQLRALLDKENPELWGHFARQAALVPDPEIVYRDFNAKAYRDITIHVDLSPDYERSLEPLESKNYFEKEGS